LQPVEVIELKPKALEIGGFDLEGMLGEDDDEEQEDQ